MKFMRSLGVRMAKKSYPTGDPKFAVMQAVPAGFSAEEADPLLMCDFFSDVSKGELPEDVWPVDWHPHAGQDICTYMKSGVGRHGDSLGNRGTFATPGMQWISVGSGIEHAEGGATPAGQEMTGFQLWFNVPKEKKFDDPKYGTVPVDEMVKTIRQDGKVIEWLLAGPGVGLLGSEQNNNNTTSGEGVLGSEQNTTSKLEGPFKTQQPLQMIDFEVAPTTRHEHWVPVTLDNCIVYVYGGSGRINGQDVVTHSVTRLDASDAQARGLLLESGEKGLKVMVFSGKRLNQPIAWHGPFVMSSREELQKVFKQLMAGEFPPKRVPWDYKKLSEFPKE